MSEHTDDAYGGYRGMWRDAETEVARLRARAESAEALLAKAREAIAKLTDGVTRYLLEEYPDGHQAAADREAQVLSKLNVSTRAVLAEITTASKETR